MKLSVEQEAIRAKCFHPTGTFVEFPKEDVETSIPERFEKITRLYPDRPAVKTKTTVLTYDQLNRSANRLAREILAQRGTGQEPVGVFLIDGARLVIAHLAVLKAGKFSVGLDAGAPQSRTAHLLTDCQTALVITDAQTDPIAGAWADCDNARINIEAPNLNLDDDNIGLPIAPGAYTYLRYTSGSTGQAKGGLKTHRHVLHAVMNATNNFHICADDRSTLLTRDASFGKYAFEVLLNGATLCPFFVKEEGLIGLAEWLIHEQCTLYYSFPTAFRHFFASLSPGNDFPEIRLVRLEGEPVHRGDVELYKKHFSANCLLVNSFSSTETGPVCLYYVDKQTEVASAALPAGYPVDGVEVLVLDELGNKVGCNQPGEIVVKSPFLSSGYWHKPELTRAKFLTSRDRGEEQLYFTGDVGRRWEDGCLELLGRKDFQVKIRSFRVDVGEVEAVLAVHPEVKEVTVVAREYPSRDTTLVAYLVPHRFPAPTATTLQNFLKARLADYMIPSTFVTLDKLPLLTTGKVDRHALPRQGNQRPDLDNAFVGPRTSVEIEITGIWREVLALDRVGIHDSFFELGGHSLAASRLISRVIQTFQLELPIKALFDAPTVAEMAAIITQNQTKQASDVRLAQIVREVEAMSEEEAQKRLSESSSSVVKND